LEEPTKRGVDAASPQGYAQVASKRDASFGPLIEAM